MTKKEKIQKRWNSLMYNHLWLKYIVEYGFSFILSVLSAAIFSFGFRAFLDPVVLNNPMVSGGMSGLSQCIKLIFELAGVDSKITNSIYSVCYLVLNIPLLILAFKGIGKRFAFFTLVNVLFVSIFTELFQNISFFNELATKTFGDAGMLARALFAGVCSGVSSAIAFKIDSSAGGFDILGYYFSAKRGTNTGPYLALINGFVLVLYTVLHSISTSSWAIGVAGLFFSIVYLFTLTLLIDAINIRNKKARVEIITDDEKLPDLLLAHIPHGATLYRGTGVFSGKEHLVVHMVVSTNEIKRVVYVAQQLDPNSFVNVTQLHQVYGLFHMKSIK